MSKLPHWDEASLASEEPALVLGFDRRRARHLFGDGQEFASMLIRFQATLGAIAELRRGAPDRAHLGAVTELLDVLVAVRDELLLALIDSKQVTYSQAADLMGISKGGMQGRLAKAREAHQGRAWIATSPNPAPQTRRVRIDVAPGEAVTIDGQDYRLPASSHLEIDRYGDNVRLQADEYGRMRVNGYGWTSVDESTGAVTLHTEYDRRITARPASGGVREV